MIGNFRGVAATLAAVGGAAALTLSGGSAARAQYVEPATIPDFAFKAGAFLPLKSDIRRASGQFSLSVEGDYVIQRYGDRNFTSIASVGYIERGDFRMIPVTVGQIYRDRNNVSPFSYYYGYGLGLYSTRLSLPDTSGRVKTLFGGYLTTGIDFSNRLFGEIKYHYVSRYDRKDVSGFVFSIGTRF